MSDNFKLAVSNIAWDSSLDGQVSDILTKARISRVEIALTRYHDDLFNVSESQIIEIKNRWKNLGIEISSLQSLFFNQPHLNLFGNAESRLSMKSLLLRLSTLASILGAEALVFGAPKNRLRGSLDLSSAYDLADSFFKEVDSAWSSDDNFIALEANPELYGCDFITKSSEALNFVNRLKLRSLKWHLDSACTELSGESAIELLSIPNPLPSHIHLSEENLGPLLNSKFEYYKELFEILKLREYTGFVVLEMRETENLQDLSNSVNILKKASRL